MTSRTRSTHTWVGPLRETYNAGEVYFMLRNENPTGSTFKYLRDVPAVTIDTMQSRLYGFVGSTDRGVQTYADGVVRIEAPLKNGRVLVEKLEGEALQAALNTLGYPDLT